VYFLTNGRGLGVKVGASAGFASRTGLRATFSSSVNSFTASALMLRTKPSKLAPPLKPPPLTNQEKYCFRSSGVQPVFSTRNDLTYSSCSSCVGAPSRSFIVLAAALGASR